MLEIRKDSNVLEKSEHLKGLIKAYDIDSQNIPVTFVVAPPVFAEFVDVKIMVESVIGILEAMEDADYMASVIKHPEADMLVVAFKIVIPQDSFVAFGQIGHA